MITEFESKDDELEYYRNYVRKVLRDKTKETGDEYLIERYYHHLTLLNNVLEHIEDKRDFCELKVFAYRERVENFIKYAILYFNTKELREKK